MLIQLNLDDCRNSLVGGSLIKSISGGQKKRLAIAVELISNPECLILDEPTSGLDSYNALAIMRILNNLKNEGKIIIATIHQPSNLIFQGMDQLLLLKDGEIIYRGGAK